MSDTADATRRTVRWLLGAQIALALGLVLVDIAPGLPNLLAPSRQPEIDLPTQPGDQTRRYRPRDPANPGPGVAPDMPRRLLAETTDIEGQEALSLRGAIAPGDGVRIGETLRSDRPAIVTLDSPGGSVRDALEIGRVMREIGAETRLDGTAVCFSACPYVFAGGTERQASDAARVGVHQHSFGESTVLPAFLAVEDIQRGQAEVLTYLDDMGIDLRVMGPALATPANEIYILTADELVEWDLVTK
ncbi:ATP-dependent Clp protease proteolytic subunit [uncultured Roseobacter sp.]|uniref:ATP-dependent Clp protease proteolytic subunit n=1 Tax=uncultured Roseobacter sp. TaxID=114847 RepID=UPI002630FCA4|nr:ATP-dependent Clp protease proteolytic subunit [uncultured Roseobacter sp.]